MKQMQLSQFINEYGFSRIAIWRLINSEGFPAYKIGGKWYVDIEKFERWREMEHRRQYKYS